MDAHPSENVIEVDPPSAVRAASQYDTSVESSWLVAHIAYLVVKKDRGWNSAMQQAEAFVNMIVQTGTRHHGRVHSPHLVVAYQNHVGCQASGKVLWKGLLHF